MIHKWFSIYDQAAKAYLPPFILPRAEMAVRTFRQCVNSPDHQFAQSPADYTLFELGTFDDETATTVTAEGGPQVVVNGLTLCEHGVATDKDVQHGQTISNGAPVQSGAPSSDSQKLV